MQTANCRPCCFLSWSSHHRLPKTQDSCKCTLTIFLRTPSDRTNSYDCERLNKRWSVASDIKTPRSLIYQTREAVSLCGIQTTRRNISNTIRSVSFDIPTREGVFYLISNTEKQYIKHEKECFIWYLTLRSNISNTRRSVLSDIQTCRSNVSNTRGSVSFDIQTPHQEVIYQTREGVFYLISKRREVIYQTRKEVFHLIFKHREVIYQTRGVFYLIYKHWEVIYQTRGVFYLIYKHRKVIYQTRKGVFHRISKHQGEIQWNLDLTKCQGTGEICSLYRRFVISNTSV